MKEEQRLTLHKINKKYKDRLFRLIFQGKKDLLELYNAINNSDYTNPEDLTITTIEDVVYMGMKNDLSFLIDDVLNLYEHQSSYSPNLPLRGLFYFSSLYREQIEPVKQRLYTNSPLYISFPQYLVFYNGTKEEPERQLLVHVEDTMQLGKPRFAVQRFRRHAQPLEVVENIGLNALQTGLGRLDAVCVNTKGEILGFNQAVVALCQLVLQHGHVLDTDAVKIVPLERDVDGAGKGFLRCCKVQKRQLKLNRAVEVVEEIAPALENRGFILVL